MATNKYSLNARPRRIALTNGGFAIVDDSNFSLVSGRQWRKQLDKAGNVASVVTGSASSTQLLHRVILPTKRGCLIDHVNGDPLDNRRANLRQCTHAQNMRNRKIHSNNRSGFKGVQLDAWAARMGRKRVYRAVINIDGLRLRLGWFLTAKQASNAYRVASAKHHGEFGRAT